MRSVIAAPALIALGLTDGFRFKKGSCGAKGLGMQIVNGEDASKCEWKWQVGLKSSTGDSMPWCGGMLIAEDWALTAAHCVQRPGFYVTAGDWKPKQSSSTKQTSAVAAIFEHPEYNDQNMHWDLALLKLATPMKLDGCVGTVCLPSEEDVIKPGSKCWITGWGTLKSGGSQPGIMQEAQVTIISGDDCVNKYAYKASDIDDESMICAQGRDADGNITDACQGDSGGPLVCEQDGSWYIHGATSWGYGCAGATYPGIWARVTAGRSWIDDVMAGKITPPPPPPQCPSWSAYLAPDSDGDCKCKYGQKCSVTGAGAWNCPSSAGPGGWGGSYFSPDCEACTCYNA